MTSLSRLSRFTPAGVALAALAACTDLPTTAAPGFAGPAPRASEDPLVRAEFVTGQVIVRWKEGADPDAVATRHRGRRKKDLLIGRAALLEVEPGQERAVVDELSRDPDVEFAEPDYLTVIVPCEVGQCQNTNDAFNTQYKWDLHNTGTVSTLVAGQLQATGKVDADIDWVEAYDALGGDDFTGTATIGIIDSGIRPTHVEFAGGRIVAARNFATGYPAELVDDRDSHGTHVAGIAAGISNGIGIAGVAYGRNIRLINAKACERYLFPGNVVQTACPVSSQADAVVWATDQGANVLNLSLGGSPTATAGSAAVQAAFQYALARNVLPVCAAGNNNFGAVSFPARFPECVAVGATSWSDTRASYSNYGSRIDVVAPGGDGNPLGTAMSLILSASNATNTQYSWKAGTSMATPQVAGLAALLYATGTTTPAAVRQRLRETADDLGDAGVDTVFGAGRINAYRALTGLDPAAPPVALIGATPAGVEGSPIAFDGAQSFDPNNKPIAFSWAFGDGNGSSAASPTHTFADNGTYAVALTVTDQSNRSTTALRSVLVANADPVPAIAIAERTLSGRTVPVQASFADAGTLDAPWSWAITWGTARTSGIATAIGAIAAERRFCGMGRVPVVLEVTDKDGGRGSASTSIAVDPNPMRVSMPSSVNLNANGVFPFTIFGSATLDVRQVDVGTVALASVANPVVKNNGSFQVAYSDVDGDGRTDLVVHVPREPLAAANLLSKSSWEVQVEATLADGCTLYVARQVIRVI